MLPDVSAAFLKAGGKSHCKLGARARIKSSAARGVAAYASSIVALRRDEQVLRFLTVALDKYGVQYNSDKRTGKVGNRRAEALKAAKDKADNAEEVLVLDDVA